MNFKALATSAVILSVFASSVSYASGKEDKGDNSSSSVATATSTNTNTNTNNNSNSNTNTAEGGSSSSTSSATGGSATANGGSATSTNTNSNTANGGAGGNSSQSTTTTLKNYNNNSSLYYPDWMNVSPNTSSFSYNSVQCQGATLNATASTLTTNTWNNGYGVQGAIGFSVPLGGQDECFAVQKKMRAQIEFKAAVEQAMMCKQLETAGVNLASRKELSVCLPQK